MKLRSGAIALTAGLAFVVVVPAGPAMSSSIFENCTNLNSVYPHGVGRAKAHDRTSGTPVTTFKRSTKIYNRANNANAGLDRDNDGVACEKA